MKRTKAKYIKSIINHRKSNGFKNKKTLYLHQLIALSDDTDKLEIYPRNPIVPLTYRQRNRENK